MLGHELRNPLAPMVTALQLLRLRGAESPEQEILERQVRHLTRMVDDLLDVSRITSGKVELHREPIELGEVVLAAMELVRPLLEQRRHHVELRVARSGAGIDVDRGRMAQVLSYLLTNAAKYSEPGSRIVVSGGRSGGIVRVGVKDEGIGLAPELLDALFEPFVQQPQALERAAGGLGLGLAIVKNLVTAHGGTVRADSAGRDRGSEFIIELPAVDLPSDATAVTRLLEKRADAAGALAGDADRRERILVVDDNHDAAQMLRTALEHLGYEVEVAHDGPSALARAETFQPSTVLLDIGLPVMDGYEVAKRLRSASAGHRVPRLLALTGYGNEADRERSRDAGFQHHLVKPIDLDRLEHVLEGTGRG